MKYEKPYVEIEWTEEEDVITKSPWEEAEDDPEEGWSGFF